MNPFTTTRVAVLRGGHASQYDRSLQTGASVLDSLSPHYAGIDVLVDQEGHWHVGGVVKSPEKVLGQVDVVFNALHGIFGEDGKVQHILELHGVPHTSSPVLSSVSAMNKGMSMRIFDTYGIKTPLSIIVKKEDLSVSSLREIFTSFPQPSIVKPISSGASLGVSVVATLSELSLAIEKALEHSESVLIQEYINGREACCGVIQGFRNENTYALPVMEIQKIEKDKHYTFEQKHTDQISFNFDSLTPIERTEAKQVALLSHRALNLGPYSVADMIIHPKRGVYLLEVNSQPSLSQNSPFVCGLKHVGSTLGHFVEHVLDKVRGKK